MKKFLLTFLLFLIPFTVIAAPFEYGYTNTGYKYVKHARSESSYQHAWCEKYGEEYENKDFTRVDCLTGTHAVEFDFVQINGRKALGRLCIIKK